MYSAVFISVYESKRMKYFFLLVLWQVLTTVGSTEASILFRSILAVSRSMLEVLYIGSIHIIDGRNLILRLVSFLR